MGDTNLGNIYYTVGMKGIADAKKQLAELSEAIKKGAISGPMPTAADFANKDAVGEKFANSIMEKTKLLQSSLEKALRASDQKTAARINSELRKLEGIDPTKGSSAVFFAKTSGYSADFVGKLEKAVAETARKAFESASKQLAQEMAQQSERANRFGAGIKFRTPAAPLAGGGVASQSFGDPGRYIPGGPRYGSFPDSGQFGQYVRPPRVAGQLAGGLPGSSGGPLFGNAPVAVSGVAGTRKVLVTANELSDVFNAGLSVRSRLAPGGGGGSGEFAEGVGNVMQNAITGKFRRLDLQPTVDRTIITASELARRRSGAGPKDYFGEGLDDFATGLFGEGGRNASGSGARRVIEEMFGEGVFGDMPSSVTTGSRRRIGKRRYRPGKSGNGNYPYNGSFGEGAYDDPPRSIVAEPENMEPYGPDPMYGPNAPSHYGLPGGPTYRGSGPGRNRLNPWLVNVDRTRRRVGHQALTADAGQASELAGEISGQVFNYDMNTNLRRARTNVIQEHLRPGHTGSDLTTRQNELVDLQEKAVHLASRRAEIEQRVNSYLGTQIDYSHKIAAEEEAALNFARQRMGRDLTQSEERGIREDTRNQSMRTMLGADASGTSSRLTTIQKELDDLNSARPGATTDLAAQMDKRIRNLREEASILVRREHLLRRQAELEGLLANGGGTWNERRLARRELGRVQTDLVQNELVGENARRHAAGQRSRNANYRMQELSYGVQDFAQVLSGGGGLDAALRAANNNISQFFAAAGGPNAARYSLMATVGVLGIAAAMKYLSDQTDLPIKKLEELTERMKGLQQVRSQAAKITEGGITGYGDTAGGNAASISSSMGGLGLGIRNRQELLGNQIDIFGGRQRVGFGGDLANVGRYSIAGLAGAVGLTGTKNEFLSKIAGSDLGTAFYERFSEGKSAKDMASLTGAVPPEMKRFFDAITKSRGTNASEAVRVFKEIDQGGGWADAKNQEEVDKLRKTMQELDADLIRLKSSAHAFDLSVSEMAKNLDRRNASLGANTSGQAQFAARSEDAKFINEARSQIRQKEGLAKYWEGEGRTDIAKSLREENSRQEASVKARLDRFGPGNSGFFTEQAASFENAATSLNEGIRSADEFRNNATTLPEQIEAARQQQAARDNADKSIGNLVSGHRFNSQRANESFMEADRELSDSYLQMIQSIDKTLDLRTNAGRRAKEGVDRAKKREDELRASSRLYDLDTKEAKASGTSFDEQRASIEQSRNEKLAKAEADYFDDQIALKKERDLINRGANRQLNDNLRNEARSQMDASTMFAGQAGGMLGGRDSQHYANAQQLQANLRAIEDAKAADPNLTDAELAQKRQEAKTIFDETAKQIEHKQVGFSDIGGMWKQIQMSLKPDKSLELQKLANDHLDNIRKMAEGAGLKVQFGLGP